MAGNLLQFFTEKSFIVAHYLLKALIVSWVLSLQKVVNMFKISTINALVDK